MIKIKHPKGTDARLHRDLSGIINIDVSILSENYGAASVEATLSSQYEEHKLVDAAKPGSVSDPGVACIGSEIREELPEIAKERTSL